MKPAEQATPLSPHESGAPLDSPPKSSPYGLINRVCLLWAGLVIGCTFIATPIKFRAPDLSLPVALEVGRLTFHAIGIAELLCAAAVLVVLVWRRLINWLSLWAVVILAVEWIFVMPDLDRQTVALIHGGTPAGSPLHVVFAALDLAKVVLLVIVGFSRAVR